MAKGKKVSISVPKTRSKFFKAFQFRIMDGVLLLMIGLGGAYSMSLHNSAREDMNVLYQNQQVFKTELAPRMAQDIDSLRTSLRELYSRLNAPKKVAPKGKKLADAEESLDVLDKELAKSMAVTEEMISALLSKYQGVQISGRSLASVVDGRDNGKSMNWVVLRVAYSFFWLMIITGLLLIIGKVLEASAKSND